MSEWSVEQFVVKVAEVSRAVGWQANVGAMELAGQIISVLYANPEHIDRFMREGPELMIDGTLNAENGSLTYIAINGEITEPSVIRARKGIQQ